MAHHQMHFVLLVLVYLSAVKSQLNCEEEYTCYEDNVRNVVWVKKDAGNIYGPNCQEMCEDALINNTGIYHSCDRNQPVIYDKISFADVAAGLNFSCDKGGGCWGLKTGGGKIMVTRGDSYEKRCYFPDPSTWTDPISCENVPGNANCYSERYSLICPCIAKALDEACVWDKHNVPQVASWGNYATGTSCIDRINYWRKRACDENWVECPPSGLPPMTECTCCHECANSQSEYDKQYGSHASFKRCGDMVQGSGGGSTCAGVIDAFVSERTADENGTMRCQGHCGPIVAHGCQTFFWGNYQGKHTLNWRTCNVDKCNNYCWNPTSNACFSSSLDIAPDTSQCPTQNPTYDPTMDPTTEPTTEPTLKPTTSPTMITKTPTKPPTTKTPTNSPIIYTTDSSDGSGKNGQGAANSSGGSGTTTGVIVGLSVTFVLLLLCFIGFFVWKKRRKENDLHTKVDTQINDKDITVNNMNGQGETVAMTETDATAKMAIVEYDEDNDGNNEMGALPTTITGQSEDNDIVAQANETDIGDENGANETETNEENNDNTQEMECQQCGNKGVGKVDENDGSFYCNSCWQNY